MTTLARPDERTDGGRHAAPEPSEPSRLDAWRSTWSVALRMARRDVRRHRGRSALVVVMVVLPTLLLSAVVTIAYTSDVNGVERLPASMGTGQARLEGPDTLRVVQGGDPNSLTIGAGEAVPVPGLDREASFTDNAEAVARLVGSPVAAFDRFGVRLTLGERRTSLDVLALDGRLGFGEKLGLTSGRWPETPTTSGPVEVLVTPAGRERGLPTSGELTATVTGAGGGGERVLRVVGTADALDDWSTPALVTAGTPGTGPGTAGYNGAGGWIVLGDDPVTWPEVQVLNTHGFRVTSAAVLRDPPSTAELPADLRTEVSSDAARTGLMVGLAATMLLVTTTLLVGPAFAVSASRQRRTLALAASNGASTPMLRRTVLAQALVLGALSAVVGVVLGVGVAWVLLRWTDAFEGGYAPFDVRVAPLVGVAACAVLSTVVAALVPARRLGRLDIVGVMRGQSVSPPPSRLVLLAGVLLTVVGAVATLAGTGVLRQVPVLGTLSGGSGETAVVAGAVVLIGGSLLLVPMILTGIGLLGSRLPTSLRMAARDLARHRARSAPSVAAVLAAVAGLTFGLTGLASDTEQNSREYLPTTLPGEVVVSAWDQSLTLDQVRATAGGLVVSQNTVFAGDPGRWSPDPLTAPYRAEFLSVVPRGCEVGDTLPNVAYLSGSPADVDRCSVAGTDSMGSGEVLLLPADELVRRLDLDAADAAAVRAGAAVLMRGEPTVRIARGSYALDPTATQATDPDLRVTSDTTVPAVVLPLTKESSGRMLAATLAFATGTPTTQGWPTRPSTMTVRTADGSAVDDATVERMQEQFGDEVSVQREDGFQRDDEVVVAILLGVFGVLILVVTLTSTALTLAEQQTDQATLAALGATRGTRRVMAAAQAFLLAAVGCVLGVAVGIVPGIAISRPLTSQGWDPLTNTSLDGAGVLVLPWLPLAVLAVAIPAVAAVLAAAGIRRSPSVTRRGT